MDEEIKQYSEDVYRALREIIGDEDLVKFYRLCSKMSVSVVSGDGFLDILRKATGNSSDSRWNALINLPDPFKLLDTQVIDSGSRAEGFVFQSSDMDTMFIIKACKIIHKQAQLNNSESGCVLLTEKENSRPGFVRLKVIRIGIPLIISTICSVRQNGSDYVSNERITEYICSILNHSGLNVHRHGPCETSTFGESGGIPEHDMATALQTDIWPEEAIGCVHRMVKHRWPPNDVIRAMVNDGCLYVPIGDKTSPHQNIEWRMSFSLAEKRLVHSMNHTQFLTYALLKLFLKEIIDENAAFKGILCSYFMKTLVFWEIVETSIPWRPSCLLQIAWNCIRRLMAWIMNEYCPNFFVPENDMFHGKFNGITKRRFFCYLCGLCSDGFFIFLQIPSLQRELDRCRRIPRQMNSCMLKRSVAIHWLSFYANIQFNKFTEQVKEALRSSKLNMSLEFLDFLIIRRLNLLCNRKLCSRHLEACGNRSKYLNELILFRLMNATSPDCVRSKMFLAIYFYRCKQYDRCIRLLYKVIRTLENMDLMYMWTFDAEKYSFLGGDELSIIKGLQKFTVSCVPLDSETCVPEISKECGHHALIGEFFDLPPLVLAYFLLFLCFFYERDLKHARSCIRQLQYYCKYTTKHIEGSNIRFSRGILGVCQEMIGDFEQALISYEQCLSNASPMEMMLHYGLFSVCKEKSTRLKSFINME